MHGRASASNAYGKMANTETDPLQQIVMLYDGAIKFLRLAAADIELGRMVEKAEHSNRVLDIIGYLQSILDFENGGEVALILDSFYSRLTLQILKASATLDTISMNHAAESLLPVRDAWVNSVSANRSTLAVSKQPSQTGSYQCIA